MSAAWDWNHCVILISTSLSWWKCWCWPNRISWSVRKDGNHLHEVQAIGWLIEHLPAELLQEMCWLLSLVWPSVIVKQDTGTNHHVLSVLNGPSQFLQCFVVIFSIHFVIKTSMRRMPCMSQNTMHITFCTDKVCLNFILQRDPLWCQCMTAAWFLV